MKQLFYTIFLSVIAIFYSCQRSEHVTIVTDYDSAVLTYGSDKLTDHLINNGVNVTDKDGNVNITILILSQETAMNKELSSDEIKIVEELTPDGYQLMSRGDSIIILSRTDRGCLYGIMDLKEQLGHECNFNEIKEHKTNPVISFRAIKFNLPWSPYRPGPATDLHKETCREPEYWEAFLDMMVENRFNALTLWSKHLFPYMIKAENYPEATPFNESELNEWRSFWKNLFKMAKDRGIETYLVNWNIVVSPEFTEAYGAEEHGDWSGLVQSYTRESVTQLINEYEDLTGLGVTLADWMGNWGDDIKSSEEKEAWIQNTFVEGMKDADRQVKFIHRAVLAGDPEEMRKVIDYADLSDKTIVEVKFNWSHGHSTPYLSLTHSDNSGTIMKGFWDPAPENYFIAWMIRNEDFFVLRWGNPDFIRNHIAINNHSYVDGYFVGSEGYIPAVDYSQKDISRQSWNYAFEKQWMFYHLWGRLIYNPELSNEILAREIEYRYPETDAVKMLEAYSLASGVPLEIASFYKSTWDFTLYSEGFLAPHTTGYDDGQSPFISLEELIRHETLDPRYLNMKDFVKMKNEGGHIDDKFYTPLELAEDLNDDCRQALDLISGLRTNSNDPTLDSELDDLETWCHIGFYFSDKLMAGVNLETFRQTGEQDKKEEAVEHLQDCIGHWKNVIRLTENRYNPMPYVSMGHHHPKWPDFTSFHWKNFMSEVERDLDNVKNESAGSGIEGFGSE